MYFCINNTTAKLGDLNVSKIAKEGLSYTQTGTPYYASPEVWKDKPYDNKSDIWSLGWVLYEAIALKPPFRAEDMQGLYKKVTKGVYPKIPNQFSSELSLIVRRLLTVNPSKRPSWDDLLKMSCVSKKISKLFPEEIPNYQSILLSTIRCPKNLMYLTDRLPDSCYYDESLNGSDSRTNAKSLHGRTNPGTDSKHSKSFIGVKTKATNSSNDSTNLLPQIIKKNRSKISSISKEHSNSLSKRKLGIKKKSRIESEKNNLSQEIQEQRINTISHEMEDYENDFDSEKEVNVSPAKSPPK